MENKHKNSIVIATKNIDKFRIVVDILSGLGLTEFAYYNLVDFNITEEMEESGTIEDRAKQKVLFYKDLILSSAKTAIIVAIIGVDDGIYIEKEGKGNAESKEVTDQILSGTRVAVDDKIIIQRSYYALLVAEKEDFSAVTNIPFQFLGNPNKITRLDGKYPLSHVIGQLNKETTVVNNSTEANIYYNVLHSDALTPLVEKLKVI